jgi:large subunit ribosomal protein L3
VLIKDAVKRKAPEGLPFPAALRGSGEEAAPEPVEEPAVPPAAPPEAAPEPAGEPAP